MDTVSQLQRSCQDTTEGFLWGLGTRRRRGAKPCLQEAAILSGGSCRVTNGNNMSSRVELSCLHCQQHQHSWFTHAQGLTGSGQDSHHVEQNSSSGLKALFLKNQDCENKAPKQVVLIFLITELFLELHRFTVKLSGRLSPLPADSHRHRYPRSNSPR